MRRQKVLILNESIKYTVATNCQFSLRGDTNANVHKL